MTPKRKPLNTLGYGFIRDEYLPEGADEYYFRNQQQLTEYTYRQLSADEVAILTRNGNYSPNWGDVWVTDRFLPEQVQQSTFYGRVRIGDMEESFLDFRDLHLPIGIYNSVIVSSDIGGYNAIHNVRYMAHFILGEEVMLFNINEMETSNNAKFGNGILKEGDAESSLIQLELCNENGGRAVLPFEGMQASDVYLWTRQRHDRLLQSRFREITFRRFDTRRGYYSVVCHRTVIKNSDIIKDVKIGTDAYIKGVNKLKNVTVNSIAEAYTQIGEGCELVNGIIGHGCRIFYGVKAVRFILCSFSQLKYGARLINSFLADNSTISCCEVLNSLLFPAHEQHHNNSFLCASLVMGQSNMAAGATVGSNHNSRGADGEIIAGRGFWPGLCVSLKHNSRFASYTLIVKGDFLHELDIRLPFTMVSHDVANDRIVILPAYWFLYNMYALMRNNGKFISRDRRSLKNQHFEYDVLAPDTVNEAFTALHEIEIAVGKTYHPEAGDPAEWGAKGKAILADATMDLREKEIVLDGVENSKRKVVLIKVREGYNTYRRIIAYYAATQLKAYLNTYSFAELRADYLSRSGRMERAGFENVGGQLIRKPDLDDLLEHIRSGELAEWEAIHHQYHLLSSRYLTHKFEHALATFLEIHDLEKSALTPAYLDTCIAESVATKQWICGEIYKTRAKDYQNPFRTMVYENDEERDIVIGRLEDNAFIRQQQDEYERYTESITGIRPI
ncbi:DUF4954 family protein [Parapedobacter indicus]|uniref:DUF4954 domain-containing protein n=1 Tax=Parapedobacter indicus TaxID=1477437 RepID=A0A1I3HNM6_9SPHI|nr:DUF4954 family protein [Parapedobacter indicus]PPL03112.1 uncharacterized protein DUF4954 [Parapedobacter indicus]SFI37388.1 protein of unknown function [Parapedobacter indicus]